MIGISGFSLTPEEKKFITSHNICGITLFSRNVKDPKQIRELCLEIQSLKNQTQDKVPLLIAIDMEGGRVARLKAPFTQWPPMKKLGDIDSPTVSFNFALAMGQELRSVGINLDFAPCLDVFTNPKNTVIGDRAVSSDAKMVEKHSSALVRGFLKAGIIPCVKHFPGHGNTLVDSHEDLPVEDSDMDRLDKVELLPFKKAIRSRLQLMMTAHILFKNVDPNWPVTLSEIFLKKILRDELRYKGLVISDDLDMKALAKNYDPRSIPVRALQAGNDILLYCNEAASPPIAIENIEKALVDGHLTADHLKASHQRILKFKADLLGNYQPESMDHVSKIVGHANHLKLSQAIQDGSVPLSLLSQES